MARTFRVEAPGNGFGPGDVIGLANRNLVLTFADQRGEPPPPGVGRWPGTHIMTLSVDDGTMRPVMDVPGAEAHRHREGGQVHTYLYTFGKGPRYAVSGGRLALVDTERFSVRSIALDDGSDSWMLRRDEPAREVTSEDVEAYAELAAAMIRGRGGMPEEAAETVKRNARQGPMASTLPVLHTIHLDKVGNLWVEPYSLSGADIGPFQVYSPSGVWLGTVAVPAGLALEAVPGALRLGTGPKSGFEIGDDYILGVFPAFSAAGVDSFQLWPLER